MITEADVAIKATPIGHSDAAEERGVQSTTGEGYHLASLVYACQTREGIVFMDLRNDKYSGISASDLAAVARHVREFEQYSKEHDGIEQPASSVDGRLIAESLVEAGILTRGADVRANLPSRAVSVRGDLVSIGDEIDHDSAILFHHVFSFVSCSIRVRLALACRPLHQIVRQVYAARSLATVARRDFDPIRAAELVSIFRRVRPFFFTARGHCLFHALALVTFLRCYGVNASWVIGVKTNPWGAHSWVQEGNYILDTNPEKVCEFTPILVV